VHNNKYELQEKGTLAGKGMRVGMLPVASSSKAMG